MTRAPHRPPLAYRDIDDVARALRQAGGRFSAARRRVLEALFAADSPLPADAVAPGLDRASVYRALEYLEELGVVRHVHLGHGPGLYALTGGEEREYLVCERCDRVRVVGAGELDDVRAAIERDFGYRARFSHFPVVGLCADCAAATDA
jgi:Fur family ferric uptake transcriptional regulator